MTASDEAISSSPAATESAGTSLRVPIAWLGRDKWLILCAATFVVLTVIVTRSVGRPWSVGAWDYFRDLPTLSLLFLGIWLFVERLRLHRTPPGLAYRALRRDFAERLAPTRLANVVAVAAAISVSIGCFTAWKLSIPNLVPFHFDATLASLDRTIHFGRYPHEWLSPILDRWWAVWAIDGLYLPVWSFAMIAVLVWQLWAPPSPRRSQYLLTFALSWIVLGALVATALSSAGPQYYADVVLTKPNPYAALLNRLAAVHAQHRLIYPTIREHLWQVLKTGASEPFAGISAMPSLHVAMSELMAIVGRKHSRFLGVPLTMLSIVTVIGSVVLGAHYAVDGYVSILAAHGIWAVSGLVANGERNHAPA
jgi:hypothetical protein